MTPVLLEAASLERASAPKAFSRRTHRGRDVGKPAHLGRPQFLKGVELDAGFVPFEMNPSEIALPLRRGPLDLTGRISTAEGDLIPRRPGLVADGRRLDRVGARRDGGGREGR